MEIKARELVAPNFLDLFKEVVKHEKKEWCLPGGRGSTKSSFVSVMIVILIIMYPKVNALVLRKYANTLRDSVYEQVLWAINILGVERYFKCSISPMRMVYIPTGQMIIFKGVDEPTKIKSIKLHSGYFGITWYEETTEFRPSDISSVGKSTKRGGELFWVFDTFNPPTNRNNWKNKDALIDKPWRHVFRSTYLTVPTVWLSEDFVEEAEWTKEHNFKLYQNEYLGECTGSGLDVFENVKDKPMTDDEIGKFDYYFHGIDWGYYPDPWAYCAMAYKPDTRELYIFDELKAHKKGNEKTSDLLLEHLQGGAWKWYNRSKPGSPAECAVKLAPDSAEPKSISDYRAYGWHCTEPVKTGLRDYGFKWLQSLTAIYIDKARAPETFAELTGYEYETDKNGEIISTYPEGQADHFIACIRYAMEDVYRRRGQ